MTPMNTFFQTNESPGSLTFCVEEKGQMDILQFVTILRVTQKKEYPKVA